MDSNRSVNTYQEMLKDYIIESLQIDDGILLSSILEFSRERFQNINKEVLAYYLLQAKRELEKYGIIEIEIEPKSRIQVIRLARKKRRISLAQIIMKERGKYHIPDAE